MFLARHYLCQLPAAVKSPPKFKEIFFFNLPLAAGGFFMVFSPAVGSAPAPQALKTKAAMIKIEVISSQAFSFDSRLSEKRSGLS